jgi:hypothetical protein
MSVQVALVGLAIVSFSRICGAQSAQPVSICDGIKKHVNGRAAMPFRMDRAAQIAPDMWKARTQITQSDCVIGSSQSSTQQAFSCTFNNGATEEVLSSYYQSLVGEVQTCLNGLDTRFDWRKREISQTNTDGLALVETTWTWTTLRDQQERQILASSMSGGSDPGNNHLIVIWRPLNDK